MPDLRPDKPAAAPDLYAALERLRDSVIRKFLLDPAKDSEEEQGRAAVALLDAVDAARLALAKARGETL